jgi:hypothetical protein
MTPDMRSPSVNLVLEYLNMAEGQTFFNVFAGTILFDRCDPRQRRYPGAGGLPKIFMATKELKDHKGISFVFLVFLCGQSFFVLLIPNMR